MALSQNSHRKLAQDAQCVAKSPISNTTPQFPGHSILVRIYCKYPNPASHRGTSFSAGLRHVGQARGGGSDSTQERQRR